MPCDRCGSILVLIGNSWVCPKCNHINIFKKDEALQISTYRIKLINHSFTEHFTKFRKDGLIAHIVWAREKFSRDFFKEYQGLDLNKFLTFNLLIKRLMLQQTYKNEITADQERVNEMIETFSLFVNFVNMHIRLMNDFANMICQHNINFREVDFQNLITNFRIIPNEHFKPLLQTYTSNDLLAGNEAEEKLNDYKQKFEQLRASNPIERKKAYSTQEFMTHFYDTINQFYCSFLRNELFAKTFDLENFGEKLLDPRELMDFINKFQMDERAITVTKIDFFLDALKDYCSVSKEKLKELFVFSENNQTIFPLFINFENHIFISHRTSYLLHIFLMAIFHNDMFHEETQKRAIALEKKDVKSKFEEVGYIYYLDIKDKRKARLQIDGLAICTKIAYVIECKEWGIRPLYDHKKTQLQIERDLKGVIDGFKISTINGETRNKRIPSLLEKVDFIKENRDKWKLNPKIPIQGLIIMRDYPPISLYKEIRIISIDEIKTLSVDKTS
jgi:phage FluMu protein Com